MYYISYIVQFMDSDKLIKQACETDFDCGMT